MVGHDRAVLGRDGRAFDQRQQVALHALAADIAANPFRAGANLVDLVQKDDAVVFDRLDGDAHHLFIIQQLVAFFGDQHVIALGDRQLLLFRLAAEGFAEHVVQVDHAHLRAGHTGDVHGRQLHAAAILDLQLNLAVGKFAGAQHLPELRAGFLAGVLADQGGQHPLFRRQLRLGRHLDAHALPRHVNGVIQQVADDAFDVAADIADLGELRRLQLDEGRLRQLRQAAGDFGLADAGRADHQDVFRQHLLTHLAFQLLPAPAIAQRDGDGALRVLLTDDVAVEFRDDFSRAEGGGAHGAHGAASRLSTVIWSLV